jgi:hypothetical protein
VGFLSSTSANTWRRSSGDTFSPAVIPVQRVHSLRIFSRQYTTRLPEHIQPSWPRVVAMWWATGFFGFFSVLLISSMIIRLFGLSMFSTTVGVVGSGIGGYALWAIALLVQIYTMYRSAQAKLNADGTVEDASEASSILG